LIIKFIYLNILNYWYVVFVRFFSLFSFFTWDESLKQLDSSDIFVLIYISFFSITFHPPSILAATATIPLDAVYDLSLSCWFDIMHLLFLDHLASITRITFSPSVHLNLFRPTILAWQLTFPYSCFAASNCSNLLPQVNFIVEILGCRRTKSWPGNNIQENYFRINVLL